MSTIEVLLERIAVALEKISESFTADGGILCNGDCDKVEDLGVDSNNACKNDFLTEYLVNRRIGIKTVYVEDKCDAVIDSLSLFMGERYINGVAWLLHKIKLHMQTGDSFSGQLSAMKQADISSICQLCTRLYEFAFIENYTYKKSPYYKIYVKTTTEPRAKNFFAGKWLERYAIQKVRFVYNQIKNEYGDIGELSYIVNPQIILPNGDDFELDILFSVGTNIYWVEAKSGGYQQHIAKYSKFAKTLGLDAKHSFMLLTDVSNDCKTSLTGMFAMTVCDLTDFDESIREAIRNDSMHF